MTDYTRVEPGTRLTREQIDALDQAHVARLTSVTKAVTAALRAAGLREVDAKAVAAMPLRVLRDELGETERAISETAISLEISRPNADNTKTAIGAFQIKADNLQLAVKWLASLKEPLAALLKEYDALVHPKSAFLLSTQEVIERLAGKSAKRVRALIDNLEQCLEAGVHVGGDGDTTTQLNAERKFVTEVVKAVRGAKNGELVSALQRVFDQEIGDGRTGHAVVVDVVGETTHSHTNWRLKSAQAATRMAAELHTKVVRRDALRLAEEVGRAELERSVAEFSQVLGILQPGGTFPREDGSRFREAITASDPREATYSTDTGIGGFRVAAGLHAAGHTGVTSQAVFAGAPAEDGITI